ncbi:MAG: DUF4911 domain-containing protein [Deltaproteobacteria bacterium]|nr:DUF4911 domain-containing protein [Deltaproteobacteria bacterium]
METVRYSFCVCRSDIAYLRTTIESYDGTALVTTVDPSRAMIEIRVAPGCERLVFELLDHLSRNEEIALRMPDEGNAAEGCFLATC